jgi:hypothetical protein
MLIKLNCQCGTRYSFDVEPVNGLMPFTVACPSCGADGTSAANAIIAQTAVAAPQPATTPSSLIPQAPPAAAKPRLRTVGAHSAPAPTAAAAAPVASGVEMCSRHHDIPASAHCTVCKKPICPECMSMFGYLCSINCRYQAEQQGIQVPKYKFQKRSVEAREFRKGAMITVAVVAVVLGLIAAWYWYDIVGSKPKLAMTIPVGGDRDIYSQFLGENKILMVSASSARLYDIKAEKDAWTADLKDAPKPKPTPPPNTDEPNSSAARAASAAQKAKSVAGAFVGKPSAAKTRNAATAAATAAAADSSTDDNSSEDVSDMSYEDFGGSSHPKVYLDTDNVWICSTHSVKCIDQKSGQVKNTIPVQGHLIGFTPGDGNFLLVTAPSATRRSITRIDIPSGNLTTNEVYIPKPTLKALKPGQLPPTVEPTARLLLHQELEDRKIFRLNVVRTSSEFFSSGENLVELRVRLVEAKMTAVESMKKKKSTMINGGLTSGANTAAVASEIFNDIKRSETGGFREIDESTYAITLRRWTGKETNDWTGEVIGLPLFFSCKTIDLLIANKRLIAFDKQNKKLFEATMSYGLAEAYENHSSSQPPALELDNVLYFYDQGVLTAFELPTGNVRWRLPTVGITCIQPENGMLYINTSSAAPESIQYTDQISFDKTDAILLKVDAKTGTTIWKSVNHGQQTFLAGKYVYETSSFVGGLAMGNALRDAFGMASHGPTYFHIYRLDPKKGDLIWDYADNKDGTPSQIDFQNNKILLNYGKEIRVMKFMQLF